MPWSIDRQYAAVVSLAALVLLPVTVLAQISNSGTVRVALGGPAPTKDATWSPQLRPADHGLQSQPVDENSYLDFWFQSPPVPTGPSWRPPRAVTITVALSGIKIENHAAGAPAYLQAFVRYSADRVHYSTWYRLTPSSPATTWTPSTFEVRLALPRAAEERYEKLMMDEWWLSKPAWSSDDHEFCVWLAARHRDYFEKEIPFIGYLQVRVEGWAQVLHVESMVIEHHESASGFQAIPDGPRRATADGPWFFDLAKTGGR